MSGRHMSKKHENYCRCMIIRKTDSRFPGKERGNRSKNINTRGYGGVVDNRARKHCLFRRSSRGTRGERRGKLGQGESPPRVWIDVLLFEALREGWIIYGGGQDRGMFKRKVQRIATNRSQQ